MKTKRKSPLKRTVALLLTICSLLAVMVPAVSAEEAGEPVVDFEVLRGSVVAEFDFNTFGHGAVSEVNGHDYLFIPHHKMLFVYDLDTWEKVDEEYLGMTTGYGCFVDSNGIVWAYGSKNAMLRYDPVTGNANWTSTWTTTEGSGHIHDVVEVNGKLYMGTYNKAELVEYDPATDTFTNLGALSDHEKAVRVCTVDYKDGFIYATVLSSKSGVDPHVVVKYDLANKKVVETLSICDKTKYHNDTQLRGGVLVGNTLIFGSRNQVGMCAIDISGETMRIIDPQAEMGLPAGSRGVTNEFSEVIIEKDDAGNVINEKVYFMLGQKRENVDPYGWSSWSYIYEYNSNTGKATPVESFPHATEEDWVLEYIHTKRGCLVTVGQEITGIEGWEGPSILTIEQFGKIVLFNLASGKRWEDASLTDGDGTGNSVLCITPGPKGTNTLSMGCYLSEIVSVYDITTGEMKQYPAYAQQVPLVYYDQDGRCYATGYDAASLSELDLETGEVKVLFELNDTPENKFGLLQERLHNMTSGDGKIFVTAAPQKGLLGGYLTWYDYDKQATYLAVESDKVIYLKDSDKTTWYDAKTNEAVEFTYTDGSERNYKGLIADQIPKSIVYQDGYVYGGTGIEGGSGSTPKEGESAVLFAYDVANMKLVTLDIREAIEGLPETVSNIRSVAADPDVPGKFWGQVAGTLFSFTYDKATETFNLL